MPSSSSPQRSSSSEAMDNDTTLLSRVSTNHLFLSQFEAFRATILILKRRNPELALSILQTVVANGGKFDNIIYSPNCSSPALLTWLCSTELLQFDKPASIWSIDPDALKLRVEFLLYVQMISSRVSNGARKIDYSNASGGADAYDEFRDSEEELNRIMHVLDELMELGFRRLKEDVVVVDESEGGEVPADVAGDRVGEEELECLRQVILQNMDVFDALCISIQKQVGEVEHEDSALAITLKKAGRTISEEEDLKLLKMIQRKVQLTHLDAVKFAVNGDNLEGAGSHIQYLHLDYGIAKEEYRVVFQEFFSKILSMKDGYGNDWLHAREKFLSIYQEALLSNCIDLVQMIQIEVLKAFNDSEGPQWKHSLFGNPNDSETFKRRCQIAETLAEKNYDLAFRLICEFSMPAVDIYAAVAASLAERKKGSQLTEFFKNIKGMLDDEDWDQIPLYFTVLDRVMSEALIIGQMVLGASINVYANKHKERPDRLIDMLMSSHRKVLACVVCGRLKSAFQIASRSGSIADV